MIWMQKNKQTFPCDNLVAPNPPRNIHLNVFVSTIHIYSFSHPISFHYPVSIVWIVSCCLYIGLMCVNKWIVYIVGISQLVDCMFERLCVDNKFVIFDYDTVYDYAVGCVVQHVDHNMSMIGQTSHVLNVNNQPLILNRFWSKKYSYFTKIQTKLQILPMVIFSMQ